MFFFKKTPSNLSTTDPLNTVDGVTDILHYYNIIVGRQYVRIIRPVSGNNVIIVVYGTGRAQHKFIVVILRI